MTYCIAEDSSLSITAAPSVPVILLTGTDEVSIHVRSTVLKATLKNCKSRVLMYTNLYGARSMDEMSKCRIFRGSP